LLIMSGLCLQCFDTVSWTSVINEVLAWLSVWVKVQIVCIWSGQYHSISKPIISCLIKIQNGFTFWYCLAHVVVEKRTL